MAKKSARTYQGRFKGTTDTHLPNPEFRARYSDMNWESMVYYECPVCNKVTKLHRLEAKYFICCKEK